MANIRSLLNSIKIAKYGRDVRDAIHDAINQCYIDAIDADNKSMEVAQARGEFNSLLEHINSIKLQQVKNYESVEIANADANITLQDKKFYICTSKLNSLSIVESNLDINFSSRLYFESDSDFIVENIKFTGEHTDSGNLQVKKGYIYIIDFIYPNRLVGIVNIINVSEGDNPDVPSISEGLHNFKEGLELVAIAKTYFDVRDQYMRYGQTNICTNNGNTSWEDATSEGADSPDGRYRKLDCSAFSSLVTAGITFNEVFKDKTTYNNRDLSARIESYPWAVKLPRTAAEQCKYVEELGWALNKEDWHTETEEWGGLQAGDLIFFGNANNGRYKGVYHVAIYYGEYTAMTGENKLCVIDCSSNSGISRHSDNITKGVRIIQFTKMDKANIVTIARNQNGAIE